LSDTHNRIEKGGVAFDVPAGDVLIHGGDFTNTGSRSDCEAFATWIEKQPHTHKVVIAGNHDLSFDELSYAQTRMDIAHGRLDEVCPAAEIKARLGSVCHYLEDSAVEIEGVTFYGSPWTPTFYNWAFNQDRGEEIAATWRKIPAETDVLLTHGPPVGHGDLCSSGNRAGCVDLLREIETRVRPIVHIFGHIHEGYGAWASPHCPTTFINASICTLQYNPTQGAIVFDVPKPGQPST
jgi:Icc-related predicted phosphoesterase